MNQLRDGIIQLGIDNVFYADCCFCGKTFDSPRLYADTRAKRGTYYCWMCAPRNQEYMDWFYSTLNKWGDKWYDYEHGINSEDS
jgi:hypothetical protein